MEGREGERERERIEEVIVTGGGWEKERELTFFFNMVNLLF